MQSLEKMLKYKYILIIFKKFNKFIKIKVKGLDDDDVTRG
jgi:hypothetical protein